MTDCQSSMPYAFCHVVYKHQLKGGEKYQEPDTMHSAIPRFLLWNDVGLFLKVQTLNNQMDIRDFTSRVYMFQPNVPRDIPNHPSFWSAVGLAPEVTHTIYLCPRCCFCGKWFVTVGLCFLWWCKCVCSPIKEIKFKKYLMNVKYIYIYIL